jgi:hypothetical protein
LKCLRSLSRESRQGGKILVSGDSDVSEAVEAFALALLTPKISIIPEEAYDDPAIIFAKPIENIEG